MGAQLLPIVRRFAKMLRSLARGIAAARSVAFQARNAATSAAEDTLVSVSNRVFRSTSYL